MKEKIILQINRIDSGIDKLNHFIDKIGGATTLIVFALAFLLILLILN